MFRAIAVSTTALAVTAVVLLAAQQPAPVTAAATTIGDFTFTADARGVSQLKRTDDPFNAMLMPPAGRGRGGAAPAEIGRAHV